MILGRDVYIADAVKIKRPALFTAGNHVAIDDYFYCTTRLDIGNYVHISPMVSIIGGANAYVKIGNFCTISSGARLIGGTDEMRGYGLVGPLIPDEYRDLVSYAGIIIEDFVSVGTNAIIMPGVTLREGTVIGAGTFVNKSTNSWAIYAGSPMKKMRDRNSVKMIEYAKKLMDLEDVEQ